MYPAHEFFATSADTMRWHVHICKAMAAEDKDCKEEEESKNDDDGDEDDAYLLEEVIHHISLST